MIRWSSLVAAALLALAITPGAEADETYDCGYLAAEGCAESQSGSADGPTDKSCRIDVESVSWTGSDWERLARAVQAHQTPCGEYWISIPPLAADKKGLRVLQDDVLRALGVHPVAEFTVGEATGWANWVLASPTDDRTWFTAGVEFRRRMAAAGYHGPDETWLLNEFDRSTMRDAPRESPDQPWPAFPRAAMVELLQGLYYGDVGMEPLPGLVEIGVHFRHQNMPSDMISRLKADAKAWFADNAFWSAISPAVRWLGVEAYPDVRNWGVPGSSRGERRRHLEEYLFHLLELVRDAPKSVVAARDLFERAYLPLVNGGYRAKGGEKFAFVTGHGQTMVDAATMQSFVSEQVHAVRHYAAAHTQGSPGGRIGFSWQPCNRIGVDPPQDVCEAVTVRNFVADIDAVAARIATAIADAYAPTGPAAIGACRPPQSDADWCEGEVPGAAFTDDWSMFGSWD